MLRPLSVTLVLSALSVAIFLGTGRREGVDFIRAAPASALAVLMINEPARDLDLAGEIKLGDWFSGDPAELLDKIPTPIREQMGALMREDLAKAMLIVHGLEKRESGAWKIHFTALLQPRPRHGLLAEKRIEAAMSAAFGPAMDTLESESLRVYRGAAPEQTLYQVRLAGALLLSNTAPGRDDALASWMGKQPRMAERPGFQLVRSRLPIDRGVFFYCDGPQILPLLPEFGYQAEWVGDQARARTFVVP